MRTMAKAVENPKICNIKLSEDEIMRIDTLNRYFEAKEKGPAKEPALLF